jgi:hypothetical protein
MNGHKENLDRLAAAYSQKMVEVIGQPIKKKDRVVKANEADTLYTKALGVLQEHGLYAMALYLLYRSGNQSSADTEKYDAEELVATQTMAHLWQMLGEDALAALNVKPGQSIGWETLNGRQQKEALLSYFSDHLCAGDLGRLLFVKELLAQTLTYARYHARALRE